MSAEHDSKRRVRSGAISGRTTTMQVRLLVTTSATALFLATGVGLAQDEITSDSMVSVSVDGTLVEVPVSLAAQACGLDEATVMANAFMDSMDAREGSEDVTASPEPMETTEDMMSSEGTVTTGATADAADTSDAASQPDSSAADDLAAADVADEAITAAEVGDDTTGLADAATKADNSADSATADEAAETVDGLEPAGEPETAGLPVCEIDQPTAEQFGVPAGG
jgi:hypothetical protein